MSSCYQCHCKYVPPGFQGWLLHFFLLHYYWLIVSHVFLVFGSYTGGLVGSLHPSIHEHLFTASTIASKANVGGMEEQNHLSNIATGNL